MKKTSFDTYSEDDRSEDRAKEREAEKAAQDEKIRTVRSKIKRLSDMPPPSAQDIEKEIQIALTEEEQGKLKELYKLPAALQMAGFLSPILGHLINGGMSTQDCLDYVNLNTKAALHLIQSAKND